MDVTAVIVASQSLILLVTSLTVGLKEMEFLVGRSVSLSVCLSACLSVFLSVSL